MKPVINVNDAPLREMKGADGAFEAKFAPLGPAIGSVGLGCMITVVPPGKKAFPFHVHHVTHELFVILEGTGVYRFGGETYPIKAGDILAAPAGKGADMAHQIVNTGDGGSEVSRHLRQAGQRRVRISGLREIRGHLAVRLEQSGRRRRALRRSGRKRGRLFRRREVSERTHA